MTNDVIGYALCLQGQAPSTIRLNRWVCLFFAQCGYNPFHCKQWSGTSQAARRTMRRKSPRSNS
jgi:hypothetical protein